MQSALVLVKGVAALGDKIFVSVLTDICKLSGVSTKPFETSN